MADDSTPTARPWTDHVRAGGVLILGLCLLGLAAAGNVAPWEDGLPQWRSARVAAKSKTLPLRKLSGVGQTWRMFGTVPRHTSRLEVSIDRGGGWEVVFCERCADARWRASTFDHHRWREFGNRVRGRKNSREWKHLSRTVSGWAFADFPDADRVRLRMQGSSVPGPRRLRKHQGLRFKTVQKVRVTERGPA